MDEDDALAAITIIPAQILGVADCVGSLEKGKDADIVIFSAYPFDIKECHVERVLIDGETVYQQ
jgi:imidazolonepropionase-like amidohydrolase